MKINTLVDQINRGNIASDYIRVPEIYYYMDKVIDDINDRLQAKYPAFSEYADFVEDWNTKYPDNPLDRTNYSVLPDKWLRKIMPVGVARYYYMKDEEGEVAASDYFRVYEQELFYLVRDFHNQVPEIFQNNDGGFVRTLYEHENVPGLNPRGLVFDDYNENFIL